MSIKKNFIYNLVYQILIMILPFITTPYISRVIGVEGVGIYSYTNSIANYFVMFAMLGLNNYGNRSIARVRNDKDRLSKTFLSIYGLQFITSIISLIVYLVFVTNSSYQYRNISLIQAILIFSALLDINWFYFGIEQFKLTVTRNILIKVVMTSCVFIFVKEESDLPLYILIMAVGTLITQIVLWVFIKRYVVFVKIKLLDIFEHLKPNLILFIPVVAVSIYRIMDKIMLGILSDMTQTGLYGNSDRVVTIPLGIVAALGTVMLPKMSNMIATGNISKGKIYIRDSMQFSMFISIAMAFGLAAIAERFAPIYFGKDFVNCGRLILLLSPIVIFSSWSNVIRTQYLIPMGRDQDYIKSVILGAIINFTINFILIRKYGALGAAVGTIVAEFVVMSYQTYVVKSELDIMTYIKDSKLFIFSGTAMFVIIKFSNVFITNTIFGLLLQILLGIITYPILTVLLFRHFNKCRLNYIYKLFGKK